jgi:hypothetical protein
MLEVILSDITVMGQGYCVIGLERLSPESYRSVRPMPAQAFAWREPFPYNRGDCVRFDPVPTVASRPHVEDQQSRGLAKTGRSLSETELIECLRKAEVSLDLEHLFGCQMQRSTRRGKAVWVKPSAARRSICGCEYDNVGFRIYPEPGGFSLRAEVLLRSNERLNSVPVVDREWRRFTAELIKRIQRREPLPLAQRFLNWSVRTRLLALPHRFARIGLPRPKADQQCWLMLDSLFPQPVDSWLDLL